MTNHLPTVSIDHITKSFGEFTAVNDLSLAVYPGRIYGLLGPNGAGKTTTIRMIVNITAPDSGTVKVFDRTVTLPAGRTRAVQKNESGRATKILRGAEER
jgi:ABC-type multidrug transport system ATPase subunit